MKIIAAILLLFTCPLMAQTAEGFNMNAFLKDISPGKYYKIKKISAKKLEWEKEEIYGYGTGSSWFEDIFKNDSLKKYVSEADIAYMKLQYEQDTVAYWDKKQLNSFKVIDSLQKTKATRQSWLRRVLGNFYCYGFSAPLYNLKGNLLVIKEEFACGFMCADWCTYIYIQDPKTHKWKEFAHFMCVSA